VVSFGQISETLSGYQQPEPIQKKPGEFDDILKEIYSEMPVLKQHDFVVKKVDRLSEHGGSLEFYSPREPDNPHGKPYIELYKNAPTERADLKKAIWGDMLHHLSSADPHWKSLRGEYMEGRDKKQIDFDNNKYQQLVKEGREKRSFDDWMNYSWSDASVREPLKGNPEWSWFQTPAQKDVLQRMDSYLRTGKRD
tara:strand:+ start:105 stop:689 length:585 start_codon:yes stop_codon:yes gene_type:complete